MKLKKNDIITIPNIISLFRLFLIPVIVWLYCAVNDYYLAINPSTTSLNPDKTTIPTAR